MPTWAEYKEIAKARGALAFEVYVARSVKTDIEGDISTVQKEHLAYMGKLEADGRLMFAGPLSDETGTQMSGSGMIVVRASSLEDATDLLANDPMHKAGIRTFTVQKWLINEGGLSVRVGLSSNHASLA